MTWGNVVGANNKTEGGDRKVTADSCTRGMAVAREELKAGFFSY